MPVPAGWAAIPTPVWARLARLGSGAYKQAARGGPGAGRPRGLVTHPGRAEDSAVLIHPGVQAGSRRAGREPMCRQGAAAPVIPISPGGPGPAAPSESFTGALSRLTGPPSLSQGCGDGQALPGPQNPPLLQGDAAGTNAGQPLAPQVSWRRWHDRCDKDVEGDVW